MSIELPIPYKNRGKPFKQILAAFIANLGTINVGFAFGFSAVANPQLMAPDSVLRITKEQASWVGKCDRGINLRQLRYYCLTHV